MNEYFHSVRLDKDKCKGCINCLKRCPTEAIRVRNGKAKIKKLYCIDCGECIRICPHHAKHSTYDPLSKMENYKYKIALPPPALYAQFNNLDDKSLVLEALLKLGFDDVYEVAAAAEIISEETRRLLRDSQTRLPIISSACPSVVRLIRVRFPNLISMISPVTAPMDLAAELAVKRAFLQNPGLTREDIGVFFITPCPAKVTSVYAPLGKDKSEVDGVLSMGEVYPKLLSAMTDLSRDTHFASHPELNIAGRIGVSWGQRGGEAGGLINDRHIAVDGIENVIRVLEDLEDGKINNVDFLELNACCGGCVGGVLAVENPYIANVKINILRKYLPVSGSRIHDNYVPASIRLDRPIKYMPLVDYGSIAESIAMMKRIDEQLSRLPGLDCGCCGAPTCKSHAEDILQGKSAERECVHIMRRILAEKYDDDAEKGDFLV